MDPDSWMENYSKNLANLLFLDKLEDHMANKILSSWILFLSPELRDHPYAGGGTVREAISHIACADVTSNGEIVTRGASVLVPFGRVSHGQVD
jgi:hypothetical protein